jgi:hypothetical protein
MKVRCPNCPAVIIEFTQLLDCGQVETMRCGNCGVFLTHFWDQLGVTYTSYSIAKIQEMRDETKEIRSKLKRTSEKRTKRSIKRKPLSLENVNSITGTINESPQGSSK